MYFPAQGVDKDNKAKKCSKIKPSAGSKTPSAAPPPTPIPPHPQPATAVAEYLKTAPPLSAVQTCTC